jgi:peptide/nickel transport system substrate-binding protein
VHPHDPMGHREVFVARRFSFTLFIALLCALLSPDANAQKQGGTLRMYLWDNPPSASIHEEATVSTVAPFMSLFNNLVLFDQSKKLNTADAIQPELATSWTWNEDATRLTFKLRDDVTWHDGKPFTAKDVICTFDKLMEKDTGAFRKNPRRIWWRGLEQVVAQGDYEVVFQLKRAQPSFLSFFASGYTPIYPCHISAARMRTEPIGTGPFKLVEFKSNRSAKMVRNDKYWRKGRPYLDAIEWQLISNRSTRVLAFTAGDVDMTFSLDLSAALMKDLAAQVPNATCELQPSGGSIDLIVNRDIAPFSHPSIRKALPLALDRQAFNTILAAGKARIGGVMLPPPEGIWGMPPDVVSQLPGYSSDIEGSRTEARRLMSALGYSSAKPLKVKVSTRNIPLYRDPAVILIDQLRTIYIEGELDVLESTAWFAKVARGDYAIGLNATGVGLDDPDVNFYENFSCGSERNYTRYCNPDVDALINRQSQETDHVTRKKLVWEIERKLADEVARPIILQYVTGLCWHPHVKGFVLHHNGIFNNWRFDNLWLER